MDVCVTAKHKIILSWPKILHNYNWVVEPKIIKYFFFFHAIKTLLWILFQVSTVELSVEMIL